MPPNTVLISGPVAGAAQILIWTYSSVFLPPMSTAVRTSVFSYWELSITFYIFHRHRVYLVDCLDLICSLYNWQEGFVSFSLVTLPLGFSVVLFPPLHVGHPLGFVPEAALEDCSLPL